MNKMFETVTRRKLRFHLNKGPITVEDVWRLSLEDLDRLAQRYNRELKETAEESFIKRRTSSNQTTQLKFDVVKYIIDVKLEEAEKAAKASERAARRETIQALIEQKKMEADGAKSLEELEKELASL